MGSFEHMTKEPKGSVKGALVLLHGRGADEADLYPLLEWLDPDEQLLGICPRGPLSLPPGGAHWYITRELGHPDPETFISTLRRLRLWIEASLAARSIPISRCIYGGFSQGAVMAYALGCEAGHPEPAGVIGLSGFIPTVDGFAVKQDLSGLPVEIGHGTFDPVIGVDWSRRARDVLAAMGADVRYEEYPLPHAIDPGHLSRVRDRLAGITQAWVAEGPSDAGE